MRDLQQEQRLHGMAADLAQRDQMVRDEYQVVRAQAKINAAHQEHNQETTNSLEETRSSGGQSSSGEDDMTTPHGRGLDDNLRRQWASPFRPTRAWVAPHVQPHGRPQPAPPSDKLKNKRSKIRKQAKVDKRLQENTKSLAKLQE
ncbi:MAG: hypothetical protein LQ338_005054 [Usnochroma carphineum]|nr:MAG: hypothetical protein LQ338_005054 [Usnochroma carphineum]